MKQISLFTIIILFGFYQQILAATQIKVLRTKGNSAVIESSSPLTSGDTYYLQEEPLSQKVSYSGTPGLRARNNSIMFGGNYSYLNSSEAKRTVANIQGRYGWNFISTEVGAFAEVGLTDFGGGANTNLLGGAYFDYNIEPNRDPRSLVYGAFALLGGGVMLLNDGGSNNLLKANAGGFASIFLGNTNTAIRVEGFADFEQVNSTIAQTNLIGGGLRGFLIYYF